MNFNTDLSIASYTNVVKDIVSAHYNDKGEYIPHFGRIITMMLFYRKCVSDAHYPIDAENEIPSFDRVFADKEFQKGFDRELHDVTRKNILSFGQAYRDAQKIIENHNRSLSAQVGSVVQAVGDVVKVVNDALNGETLSQLSSIAMRYEKVNAERFADALIEYAVKGD